MATFNVAKSESLTVIYKAIENTIDATTGTVISSRFIDFSDFNFEAVRGEELATVSGIVFSPVIGKTDSVRVFFPGSKDPNHFSMEQLVEFQLFAISKQNTADRWRFAKDSVSRR